MREICKEGFDIVMQFVFQGMGEGRETTPFRIRASAKLWMENVELAGCKTVRALLLMVFPS